MICPYFYVHFKYILLEHHQSEMCFIHFKIFGYCCDWYCWHSLKKAPFSFFGYLLLAIDSTLGQLQNLSKPWIIHLLAQLIARSLSPFLHLFICRLFSKSDKWGNFSSSNSSTKRCPIWGLVIPKEHLERVSLGIPFNEPTPHSVRPQSVSKHARQRQRRKHQSSLYTTCSWKLKKSQRARRSNDIRSS